MADFITDLGCLATSSVEHFRHALKHAGKGQAPNLTPLTAQEIAFLLGSMQGSLNDTELSNSQTTSLYMRWAESVMACDGGVFVVHFCQHEQVSK